MSATTPKVRTLQMKPNSIIVYKKTKYQTDKEFETFLFAAANDVLARFGMSTIVVGVLTWDEILVLDEHEMALYGWIRKEQVFLRKDQVDLAQYTAEELEEIATMMTDNIEAFRRAQTSKEEEE